MQVAIKDKGKSIFETISNSKLLAVPYAFHAETAVKLVGTSTNESTFDIALPAKVGEIESVLLITILFLVIKHFTTKLCAINYRKIMGWIQMEQGNF